MNAVMDFLFENQNFQLLKMILGLCLFLFGMSLMGEALERRAGSALRTILGKLTTNKVAGFLTGLGVTAVIQSSSATTVMVVGFVNSGLMNLKQAINVILGANVGTTVTAWILSLSGIEGSGIMQLFKPSTFTPILALVGIVMYMFLKGEKKKDTGMILLGFATLMFGMDTMSGAVKGLANVPEFTQLFTMFENPILGLLAGAVLTAIIQSSSASVGILQALAATGGVAYGAAIPILMGQHIGTCVTAMISSVGTNKNAKRAAFVHLTFNVLAAILLLSVFSVLKAVLQPVILNVAATEFGIAVAHSAISIIAVVIFLPLSSLLEKIALTVIPDAKVPETFSELDERLLQTPQVALQRCRVMVDEMATAANNSIIEALSCLDNYSDAAAKRVREAEDMTDHYEDILGTYLVKLGSRQIGESNSAETTELLRLIGDIERIADHSVNILESVEELHSKELQFSDKAKGELSVLVSAIKEILSLTMSAISTGDLAIAAKVEPLEEVIDDLKEELRTRHSVRLSQGNCSIETGFVWSDLLTNLERVSDHCSNVAGCIIDTAHHNLNLHESIRATHESDAFFKEQFNLYKEQYKLA